MGRTVPTPNQYVSSTIQELSVIRDYLTTDEKPLWDEFMRLGHLNERAISMAIFTDPLQALMVAQLFKIFKVVKQVGGDFSEWQQAGLSEK
jgi:hypothetical protein